MQAIFFFWFFLVVNSVSAGHSQEIHELTCRDQVTHMCVGQQGPESLGICSIFNTEREETQESVYTFLTGIQLFETELRKMYLCARLMGQLVVVPWEYSLNLELRTQRSPYIYQQEVRDDVLAFQAIDPHTLKRYSRDFSWHFLLRFEDSPEVKCVSAAIQELKSMKKDPVTILTGEAVFRIVKIELDSETIGNRFSGPSGDIYLELVEMRKPRTNHSKKGFEGTCEVLREMVLEERERIMSVGL